MGQVEGIGLPPLEQNRAHAEGRASSPGARGALATGTTPECGPSSRASCAGSARMYPGARPRRRRARQPRCRPTPGRPPSRVVGHQAHLGDTEELKHFARHFVGPAVGGKAQFNIGFYRIHALILQLICLQFGHQADAAALLLLVEQNARALFGDAAHGQLQLQAAIAAQRAEDVASKALRVDADNGRHGVDVAHDQCDQTLYLAFAAVAWRIRRRGALPPDSPQSRRCGRPPSG